MTKEEIEKRVAEEKLYWELHKKYSPVRHAESKTVDINDIVKVDYFPVEVPDEIVKKSLENLLFSELANGDYAKFKVVQFYEESDRERGKWSLHTEPKSKWKKGVLTLSTLKKPNGF